MLGTKINLTAGTRIQEVPYKAIGAEMPDLLAGHVKTAYLSPVVVTQLIKAGKLVALGVAGPRRIPILPEVPTLAEAGLPGVEASGWNGLFVPAGTPRNVVRKLQADIASVMASPAFQVDAHDLGYELGGAGSDEFAAYIHSEVNKWGSVIRDARIRIQ
jgi:tripartite-type tricarboxylate transporter receptor subunit TctC